MIWAILFSETFVSEIRCLTVSLSLGCAEMRQAICLFVSSMAEELHHVQMFTEVVCMVFCSRNFQVKIVMLILSYTYWANCLILD